MSSGVCTDRLGRRGVSFDLVDGVLCVEAPLGVLSKARRHELVARRAKIERLVRVALGPSEPVVQPTGAAA